MKQKQKQKIGYFPATLLYNGFMMVLCVYFKFYP